MSAVEEHYRNLLARHYSWMFGLSFENKVAEQRAVLEPLVRKLPRGLAVDLGCGPGYQTMALSELGFRQIHAFDTSQELLAELLPRIGALPIHLHGDFLTLDNVVPSGTASVIVCMGDTLTHLPTIEAVRHLFRIVARTLAPGGMFILTWRDLTRELRGAERFIPVRADENTIMTCFLEYTSASIVQVHDLVYTRNPARNSWTLEKSSYPKLRLASAQIADELAAAGLAADPPTSAGRLSLAVARKLPESRGRRRAILIP
jgi:SAM-dependent methyltransferase